MNNNSMKTDFTYSFTSIYNECSPKIPKIAISLEEKHHPSHIAATEEKSYYNNCPPK